MILYVEKKKNQFYISQNNEMKNYRQKLYFRKIFKKLSRWGSELSRQGSAPPSPTGSSATSTGTFSFTNSIPVAVVTVTELFFDDGAIGFFPKYNSYVIVNIYIIYPI